MPSARPSFPAGIGEKIQYLSHTMNDSSTRFVLLYPGRVDIALLRQAVGRLAERVFVLRSRFLPADPPRWELSDIPAAGDLAALVVLEPGGDVLAAAERAALEPVRFEDALQLRCTLVCNDTQSALALVVSHLAADGGDAKYILKKLAELYSCLQAGGDPDTVDIKTGDRDLLQIYDRAAPEALAGPPAPRRRKVQAPPFPFPEPPDAGEPRLLRRTIPAPALAPARARAKAMGATVNDLLLAACYRAVAETAGLGPDAPLAVMAMQDLRQYLTDGRSGGICNLSKPFLTTLPHGVGADFSGTLAEIAAQTAAVKRGGLAGGSLRKRRFLLKTADRLPFRLAKLAGGRAAGSLPLGLTNLGNMTRRGLALGDLEPETAWFASQVKRKPGIQLAVMSLEGAPTLTIAIRCGEGDAALLEALLGRMEEEIRRFGEGAGQSL